MNDGFSAQSVDFREDCPGGHCIFSQGLCPRYRLVGFRVTVWAAGLF